MRTTPQLKENKILEKEVCMEFSQRFRELRRENSLTLNQIAKELGLSKQSIVYYAMGDRLPGISILIQLSNLFGVSIDYLIGRSNSRFWIYL